MAANKTVYTLDLDTSRLINNYKAALKEMQNAGVSTDITKGLETQLKKLESEYNVLANAGKAGFTNTTQITNFNKRVEKLMASFRGFETELSGVSGKIREVAQNSQKAGQKLQNAFSRVGFKDAAQQMQAVLSATDREAKLTEVVNEELKKRAQAVAQLKAEYEAAAQAAQVANTRISADTLSSNATAKINGKSMWTSGKNKPDEATRQAVVAQAQAIAQAASSGQQAWAQFCEYLRNNGLDKVFNKQALPGVEDTIKAMQANYANAAPLIEQAQQAQQRFNEAQANFNQIGKNNNGTLSLNRGVLSGLTRELNNFNNVEEHSLEVVQRAILNSNEFSQAEQRVANAANNAAGSASIEEGVITNLTAGLADTAKEAERTSKTFEQLKTRITMFFSVTTLFNSLRNQIRKTYNDVKQLDKSFASIAMVTKYSVDDMWKSYSQYAEMAGQLGQKTDDVIKASALFYQQGLDTNESLALTADTMKLATIAGNDYQTATKEMTSALRGFKMEMDEGAHVTDVYSELAAHAAARVDDIAQAMARTASIANSAGMSFENTSAFLTQMIETTQESAENIGTSLKTIIARFTELKNNVAGTSESEFSDLEYNKVDKALKSVGVQLKDVNGQFRNLDDVFLELSKKWDTLDRNTQRYVATIAAGSRQQSRFIAMMDNYERTAELIDYAADAEGKADEQFAKYADTMEYKLNQLSTTWEEFRVKLMDSDLFKGAIDGLTTLVSRINAIDFSNKFDLAKVLVSIPIVIKSIKNIGKTLVSSIQNSISSMKKIGQDMGRILRANITRALGRVPVDIALEQQQLKNKIQGIKDKIQQDFNLSPVELNIVLDNADLQTGEVNIEKLKQAYLELGYSEAEAAQKAQTVKDGLDADGASADSLTGRLRTLGQTMNLNSEKLERMSKQQALANAGMSLFSVGVSAFATSIVSYLNGLTSLGDALKTFGITLGITAAQLSTQIVLQRISLSLSKTRQGVIINEAGHVVAANGAEEASFWKVFVAENAVLAPLLAIVAIFGVLAVAIAGITYYLSNYTGRTYELKKANEELAASEKRLADAEQKRNEARSKSSQDAEDLKKAEELRKKYDELSAITNKSVEEEEEYKSVISEILETVPDIVEHYDEMNNKLIVTADLWDIILKRQKEAAGESAEAALGAAVSAYNARTNNIEADEEAWFANNLSSQRLLAIANKDLYLSEDDLKLWRQFTNDYESKNWEILGRFQNYLIGEDESGLKEQFLDYDRYLGNLIGNKRTEWDTNREDAEKEIIKSYQQYYEDLGDESGIAFVKALTAYNNAQSAGEIKGHFARELHGGLEGTGDYDKTEGTFTNNDLKSWEKVDSDVKKYIALGLGQSEEEAKQFYEENSKTSAGIESIWQAYCAGATADAVASFSSNPDNFNFSEYDQKRINDFYANIDTSSKKQRDDFVKSFSDTDIQSYLEEANKEYNKIWEDTVIYGDNSLIKILDKTPNYFEKWTNQQISSYDKVIKDSLERAGTDTQDAAEEYFQFLDNAFDESNVNIDDRISFVEGLKWEEANTLNWESFKEEQVKSIHEIFGKSEDEAEEFFNDLSTMATDANIYQITTNGAQISEYLERIKKVVDVLKSSGATLSAYIAQDKDEVSLTAGEYENLQKVFKDLKEAGIENVDDLVKYDEATGKWRFNVAELNKLINENSEQTLAQLQYAKENNHLRQNEIKTRLQELSKIKELNDEQKEEKESLENEYDILISANEAIDDKVDAVKSLNAEVEKNNKLWKTSEGIIELTGKTVDGFSKALSSFSSDGFMGADSISALNEALKISGKSVTDYVGRNLQLNTGQLYADILSDIDKQFSNADFAKASEEEKLQLIALRRELITTYDEYLTKLEEEGDKVTKAIKEKEKADKAYADQLEDVTEKQEKLNEALKEYNDLLNGSDNRKSSLDYLYNYDEAITSFNDEISRSKDLMADSKTIQDSAAALTRYAQATHNLIAEETAKQDVIKQGLANYANMIENGSYSYTNRETGATTNINFGNYAKKDSRTGKYIIDQRLLNESKFADKWKDQLEEQVSMYNKYADELLKSEDNVRKAEKEIRDERNAALKKYVSMEKEIADALKAAYQEEVDQLKDKYDSMKDADDDYIDALQKAIEKQRKLRKQEQGFEDLAKKEKQLSLMSRDTSGANAIEARKLEEDIKKDRESLLDEAIDNVVDELSKLYESQEKLRDEEMELKEALLDNTLYWNNQAEALAGSFESGEEYAQYLSSLSKEYAEMTLAMQQDKLNEYGQTYTEATEYMAMVAMDTTSETGDFIVDTLIVTGEEVSNIVAETAETFTTEVVRSYNETTAAFVADMQKAEEAIDSANKALQEAYEKLNECAQAANKAAEEVAKAYAAASGSDTPTFTNDNPATIAQANYQHQQELVVEAAQREEDKRAVVAATLLGTLSGVGSLSYASADVSKLTETSRKMVADEVKKEGFHIGVVNNTMRAYRKDSDLAEWLRANAPSSPVKRYLNGGLADYTGYAYVDGTPEEPEGFLTAEQTQAIGDAAKIFSDIPWLDHSSSNTSVVTNNGGDVNVEINLNIDHISSETDIDEMIQRVKDEIVDVARPEGTNVILQQQLN